jgi:hypothetical protein
VAAAAGPVPAAAVGWVSAAAPAGAAVDAAGLGAVPALCGLVLALVGLFALKWAGDATFGDLNRLFDQVSAYGPDPTARQRWLQSYFPAGAIVALFLGATPVVTWTLGAIRSRQSAVRRGGLTRRSLSQGNTGPTRVLISVLAGLCLAYQLASLVVFTDSGKHFDRLGPGPWCLLSGMAFLVLGAAIGPGCRGGGGGTAAPDTPGDGLGKVSYLTATAYHETIVAESRPLLARSAYLRVPDAAYV